MEVTLTITEQDLIEEIEKYPHGEERNNFCVRALRIGILALKQARGRVDVDLIRAETERFIVALDKELAQYQMKMSQEIQSSLKSYFDPQSGHFTERVERLIKQDGDLEKFLRTQIGPTNSTLSETLKLHIGKESEFFKLLDPANGDGLLAQIGKRLDTEMTQNTEMILKEFSLDNKQSALSRLVDELIRNNQKLSSDFQNQVKTITEEFSLDKSDSALSRLVSQVDQAQKQISREFTLDEESSALSRLRKEINDILQEHAKENQEFRSKVYATLEALQARRKEAEKSTRHGLEFENAVYEFIAYDCRQRGDIPENTGNTTGTVKNCKVGDATITLSSEHTAAGATIVIESKEDQSCDLKKALDELLIARKNRNSQVGLFVFSRKTAPGNMEALARYNDCDIVVVWDSEDGTTDVYLKAGLALARALCVRSKSESMKFDVQALMRSITNIQRQAEKLDDFSKKAETIKGNSIYIIDQAAIMRKALDNEIGTIDRMIGALKEKFGDDTTD